MKTTINPKTRQKDIIKMYKNRYTLKVIGEKYGITKQRAWQILRGYKGKVINS